MHLKSISLKGFKSFPDRTRLDFGPGVWVIVGPTRTYVVDTGFDAAMAERRKRDLLKPVGDGLKSIGIEPDRVENIIVTDNTDVINVQLGAIPAGSNGVLMGTTQLTVQGGIAVFDQLYIQQAAPPPPFFTGYTLKATTTGLKTSNGSMS